MDLPPLSTPATPTFKDRHAWLIVFGILEILLGAFCALLIPFMLLAQAKAAEQSGVGHNDLVFTQVLPGLVAFAGLSIGLIWLGIGSTLARRWARALLLCLGWMGLCVGVVSLAVMIPVLNSLDGMIGPPGTELPPGAFFFIKIVAVVTIAIVYVLIPGVIVLFYRGPNVRLTCEARDLRPRWTDHCPLPVIAVCIMQVFAALSVLMMPKYGGLMPLAGFLVTGWPARLGWLAFAGFSLYAARGFYRLERPVWLVYVIVIFLFWLSYGFTFLHVGLLEYYRAVGLPESQIEQLARSPLVSSRTLTWICSFSLLPFFGYLFYVRRFFPAPTAKDSLTAA